MFSKLFISSKKSLGRKKKLPNFEKNAQSGNNLKKNYTQMHFFSYVIIQSEQS